MILWLAQNENSRQKLEQVMRPEEGVLLVYLQHKDQNRTLKEICIKRVKLVSDLAESQ